MRTKRANIDDFMNRTKTDLVSGYRKQVDFIESTAWEMIYISYMSKLSWPNSVFLNVSLKRGISHYMNHPH